MILWESVENVLFVWHPPCRDNRRFRRTGWWTISRQPWTTFRPCSDAQRRKRRRRWPERGPAHVSRYTSQHPTINPEHHGSSVLLPEDLQCCRVEACPHSVSVPPLAEQAARHTKVMSLRSGREILIGDCTYWNIYLSYTLISLWRKASAKCICAYVNVDIWAHSENVLVQSDT